MRERPEALTAILDGLGLWPAVDTSPTMGDSAPLPPEWRRDTPVSRGTTGPPQRHALYQAAVRDTDLDAVEYQTIHDLCELGDMPPGEARTALEAVLIALFLARRAGAGSIPLAPERISACLPESCSDRMALAETFFRHLELGTYRSVIGTAGAGDYPPLQAGDGRLAFQRYRAASDRLAAGLRRRLTVATATAGEAPISAGSTRAAAALAAVLATMPWRTKPTADAGPAADRAAPTLAGGAASPPPQRVKLDARQESAVRMALQVPFGVITGGPGTGKTSIVFTVLRCLLRAGVDPSRIGLAAPTGRAAQRLGESLRDQLARLPEAVAAETAIRLLEPCTLHRLLGYSPTRLTFAHDADEPLQLDYLLVDETSMVDTELMSRLLAATPPETRLILLGDKDQLPSVEVGTVLADLVGDAVQSTFEPDGKRTVATPAARSSRPTRDAAGPRRATASSPAVTAGDAVRPPVPVPVVVLDTCYRSNRSILEVAQAVNRYSPERPDDLLALLGRHRSAAPGAAPDVRDPTAGIRWHVPEWSPAGLQPLIERWVDAFCAPIDAPAAPDFPTVLQRCLATGVPASGEPVRPSDPVMAAFAWLTARKILTAYRDGWFGVAGINRLCVERLLAILHRGLPSQLHGCLRPTAGGFFPGAVVMVTRNDYRLELFNGDIGLILPGYDGGLCGVFPRPGTVLRVALDELPGPELAFASTVHKAQGSEFDQVTLILPPPPTETARRLLTRQIVYTGLTRARTGVTLLADEPTLLAACARRAGSD